MSWDPQIESIIGAGFSAAIYAADTGVPYTTDSLKMTLEEVQNACKAVKEGAAGAVNASVGGKTYMVLRNDEDLCYFPHPFSYLASKIQTCFQTFGIDAKVKGSKSQQKYW